MMLSKREAIDDTAEIGSSDTKISINDTKIGTNSTDDIKLDQDDKEEENSTEITTIKNGNNIIFSDFSCMFLVPCPSTYVTKTVLVGPKWFWSDQIDLDLAIMIWSRPK